MNIDDLKAVPKDQIPHEAKNLTASEVAFLIETLAEKDDAVRYSAFLLLQAHSRLSPLVYPFWSVLEEKLGSDNSYQRSLGLMLISENVRWDSEGKFAKTINQYLKCCTDEKFITARQAILGLANVAKATDAYNAKIRQYLSGLDFVKYKENQQKLLKKDAASILKIVS